MNTSEVKHLLAVIAARYPASKIWGETDEQAQFTVKAWQMTLDDIALGDAQRVLVGWFKSHKWAPDPSEIRELLAEAVNPVPDEGEAWRFALRWVRKQVSAPETVDEHFAVACIRRIGEPRECGQMELSKLREMFGFEYRRMVAEERTERTAAVGELAAAGGLRAIS